MIVELFNVRKTFAAFELGPLSMTLTPGKVYGLLGANGAGKTTLMNLVTMQLRPTGGEVRVDGRPVRWGDRGWKTRLAYIRETPALYDEFTVRQTLAFVASVCDEWDQALAEQMAHRLQLDMTGRVRRLSKGTKVKLALVAALAQNAWLLVLDEPTAGLDPTARGELHGLLQTILQERPEVTLLLSSHLFEDMSTLADEVHILRHGKLAFSTSRQEVEGLALFRVPGVDFGIDAAEARLVWRESGDTCVIASRASRLAAELHGRGWGVLAGGSGLLEAAYRGVERQEMGQ
jgi:ABC-2 type transport system ATP-binding protein